MTPDWNEHYLFPAWAGDTTHLPQVTMPEHQQLRELISIYALGALPPDEATRLETHFDHCVECVDDLSVYLTTAAALAGQREPLSRVWDAIAGQIDAFQGGVVVELPDRRLGKFTRTLLSVAAALALVFAGAIVSGLAQDDGIARSDVIAAADEAANQPGSLVASFQVEAKVVARIVLTQEGQGYIIPTAELPELDASRTYQLWVVNSDDAVISAGVLGNRPAPSVFTWSGEVTSLALTREVAGGVTSSDGDVVSVAADL